MNALSYPPLGANGAAGIPAQNTAPLINGLPQQNATTPPPANQGLQEGPMLQMLVPMMEMMMSMLQMLMSLMGGGQQQQQSRALPPLPQKGSQISSPLSQASPPSRQRPPKKSSSTGNPDNDLKNSLEKIAEDAEGRLLLEEAERKGISVSVGDTGSDNVLGFFKPDNQGGGKITVGDGDNLKTIIHELVHAVSSEDGNSQHEEGIANIVGNRVASRILGEDPQSESDSTQIYNRTLPLYGDLNRFNKIENTLGKLGITA